MFALSQAKDGQVQEVRSFWRMDDLAIVPSLDIEMVALVDPAAGFHALGHADAKCRANSPQHFDGHICLGFFQAGVDDGSMPIWRARSVGVSPAFTRASRINSEIPHAIIA